MKSERQMVGWYISHTWATQRSVRPLDKPTKKFSVTPASIDSTTGTTRKAHTRSVKPS